jgi:uncharacterized protein YggE
MRRQLLFLLASAATAIAQTDTNTITITASRNVSVAPDQVVYSVSVETDLSAGLSDATALVADAGITAAELSYVSSALGTVTWVFKHVVPFSSMKDTNLNLAKVVKQAATPKSVPSISYSVASVQTSQATQSQACQLSALVSDARREAERLASIVGVHVGAIVGLSDQPDISPVIVPTFVARVGNFSSAGLLAIPIFENYSTSFIPQQQTPCSLVVQFRLLP